MPKRVYVRSGTFYYVVPGTEKWVAIGKDVQVALRRATELAARAEARDSAKPGTIGWWLDRYIESCEARVGRPRKERGLSRRTVADYTDNAKYLRDALGHLLPLELKPKHIAQYLDTHAAAGRAVRANREIACLSGLCSWLMRAGELDSNPCRGVRKNRESKRDRYVTDEELQAVHPHLHTSVWCLLMLVYRTLQRPEDVIAWTRGDIVRRDEAWVLRAVQAKTRAVVDIAIDAALIDVLAACGVDLADESVKPDRPLLMTRTGTPYTYDGLSAMLKRATKKANISTFGPYDMKGKGATDMWRNGVPLERIQVLCGHTSVMTTEVYVKQRWSDIVVANPLPMPMSAPRSKIQGVVSKTS